MTRRCPSCNSTVLVERELDRDALVCLGCGRHWERATEREEAYAPALRAARERRQPRDALLLTRAAFGRRCPFCRHHPTWRAVDRCAPCGARLSALDGLGWWRALRRMAARLHLYGPRSRPRIASAGRAELAAPERADG